MTDEAFRKQAAEDLDVLFDLLATAGERHGFEADMNGGALTVEFDDPPAKFVVSPNSPVKQIWVSAHSRSFKFDWDKDREEFVLPGTNQSLVDMMSEAISKQLGKTITL